MTQIMDTVTQDALGGPEVLYLGRVPRPSPGIGEILVRVRAAGVNPADAMYRQSGAFGGQLPFTLGWDVSGFVETVGPRVDSGRTVSSVDVVHGVFVFRESCGTAGLMGKSSPC